MRIRREKPVTEYSLLVAAALLGAQALHLAMPYALVGTFAILAFARTVTAWSLLRCKPLAGGVEKSA